MIFIEHRNISLRCLFVVYIVALEVGPGTSISSRKRILMYGPYLTVHHCTKYQSVIGTSTDLVAGVRENLIDLLTYIPIFIHPVKNFLGNKLFQMCNSCLGRTPDESSF